MSAENRSSLPNWLSNLDDADLKFIKEFILCSGSLKDIAKLYDVSYPTVRIRLDKLIAKVKLYDDDKDDAMISLIKMLAMEEKISLDVAKLLLDFYRKEK